MKLRITGIRAYARDWGNQQTSLNIRDSSGASLQTIEGIAAKRTLQSQIKIMAMSARLLVKKGERQRWFRGSLRFLRHSILIGRRVQTEEGTEVTNIMVKILHRCSPCSRTPRTKKHCYVQWSYDRQCSQIWDHQWEKKKPHGIVSKISVHHYHVTNH